jgi:prolyl oligopeptidase
LCGTERRFSAGIAPANQYDRAIFRQELCMAHPHGLPRFGAVVAACLVSFAVGAAGAEFNYPPTPKRPVTEVFHGVSVVDDYRWLEDDASAEVKDWVAAQNAVTRKALDAVPQRAEIVKRVQQLVGKRNEQRSSMRLRGGRVFALRRSPLKNQPVLVVLPLSLETKQERVVFDPTEFDPSGRTAIDFFVPSFDGRLVAV